MPFTISHAAAVLPFARPLARWRLLSATIIGSMVPDFGVLLPSRPPRIETHSAIALVTFCLPVGLVTFWVFQQLLKRPVMAVLPDAAYARWRHLAEPADIASLKQWLVAACGVALGSVTHLIWDGFTHEGARGVRMMPVLDDPVFDIAGHRLVGARLLQDVSSVVGLAIVLVVVAYALRPSGAGDAVPNRVLTARERHRWIGAYALAGLLITGLFLLIRRPHHEAAKSLSIVVGNYAIAVLRGGAAALVAVSLALTAWLRPKP